MKVIRDNLSIKLQKIWMSQKTLNKNQKNSLIFVFCCRKNVFFFKNVYLNNFWFCFCEKKSFKMSILTKFMILFLWKKNRSKCRFWQNFWFSAKMSIFDNFCCFGPKCRFLKNFSIFDPNVDCWQKNFGFLPKILHFCPKS